MSGLTDTIVQTKSGKIEGAREDNILVFRGVPYATPPIGENRWLPPEPVKPWAGVRQATKFTPIAPQVVQPGGIWAAVPEPQNEDCLYLNIWTPGLDNEKRPVMVWIHGGGFTGGSGSGPGYRGNSLVRRGNAVVVTLNYRLGSLGFLRLNEVTSGRIPNTGNEGLLDQAMALQWIKENITGFGGNPNNITIFGESAGGMSIGCQLSMPGSKGLFHKAILQSGAASNVISPEVANRVAEIYLDTIGIKGGDVDSLYTLSTQQLIDGQNQFSFKVRNSNLDINYLPFQPVIDGAVIPIHPLQAVKEGSSNDIPIIVGSTLNEWEFFTLFDPAMTALGKDDLLVRLKPQIPTENIPGIVDAYIASRKARGLPFTDSDIYSAIQTDLVFRLPAIWLAEAKQCHKQPAYHYIFTWPSPFMNGKLEACHAIDVPFTWGSYEPVFSGTGPKADTLARNTQEAWLAFAHNGKPDCDSLGKWPAYGNNRETMILGENCHLENDPLGKERIAWHKISDKVKSNF